MSIRVLIADDHAIMRSGLAAILSRDRDIDIVGEAETGTEAIRLCRELRPDVVIMDIAMNDLNGIEATRRILHRQEDVRVVALSSHKDSRYLAEILRAGAMAYVLKDNAYCELRAAIDHVVRGEFYLCPAITSVAGEIIRKSSDTRSSAYALLGNREREILQLLAEGLSTPKIAKHLNISPNTVETHRRNIMQKLDIHNIVELTRFAIREGLTHVDT